ncbi:MAG: type II toxin-antitoxin system VapC family toxin [Pseudomonadota bacterium]|nr:type II toxin-antitoxin system VapC family toxin [Pseudomonadota bacterium]
MSPVLNASVFIAAISPTERHHHQARRLFDSHPDTEQFLVPELFRVEVIAGLSRRGEPADFLDTVDAVIRGPRFHARPLDGELLERAVHVARVARLRAYDAVYVALALMWNEPILTLDGEVVERTGASFGDLRVFGST